MAKDPSGGFSLLLRACVRDDDSGAVRLASMAASFISGVAASAATAYLLSLLNL